MSPDETLIVTERHRADSLPEIKYICDSCA